MKGIILAAGRGSRMNHLTEHRPKCLLKFRSIPLLNHQLTAFKECGIKEVALVTGYKREMLSKYNLFQFHNDRWADTQMVYSLTCASDWLEKYDCVIILTDHININYNLIKENANFIVDTRNIYKNKSNEILKL